MALWLIVLLLACLVWPAFTPVAVVIALVLVGLAWLGIQQEKAMRLEQRRREYEDLRNPPY